MYIIGIKVAVVVVSQSISMYSCVQNNPIYQQGLPTVGISKGTGVTKRGPFLRIEKFPKLLSDDRECELIENVDFKYSSNLASLTGNPVFCL